MPTSSKFFCDAGLGRKLKLLTTRAAFSFLAVGKWSVLKETEFGRKGLFVSQSQNFGKQVLYSSECSPLELKALSLHK